LTRSEAIEKARLWLATRRYAYQTTFKGPLADNVLRDLAEFCRANKSTFHENDRAHALAEGRREVWLRIQQHLRMTEAELWNLYDGRDA